MLDALFGVGRATEKCASVEDLQGRLCAWLESKASPTSAEHVSVTFEFPQTAVFALASGDGGNDAGPGGGAPLGNRRASRSVNAAEAIRDQHQDDPKLQRDIAAHIVNALSRVDGSCWALQQATRSASGLGWTFTYTCQDSLQAWARRQEKASSRPVIAEYSGVSYKDGFDPINTSGHRLTTIAAGRHDADIETARPAFDCRGCITIAFARKSRAINVKYEHTPLHKSVSELLKLFAPPSPPPEELQASNTPKTVRASKTLKVPRFQKSPRMPTTAGESMRRAEGDGWAMNGSGSKKRPRTKTAVAADDGADDTPDATSSRSDEPFGLPSLHLPPAEIARRKHVALKLLAEHNINPATLSPEQFSLFADQSPELQQESLVMFVKYGAARLRIVHPEKETASSSQTPKPNSTSATPDTTEDSDPALRRKSKKKQSLDAGDGNASTVASMPRVRKPTKRESRAMCTNCKANRLMCSHERPACSSCIESGMKCKYPPYRSRKGKDQSETMVAEEADADVDAEDDGQSDFVDSAIDGANDSQIPASGMTLHSLRSEVDTSQYESIYGGLSDSIPAGVLLHHGSGDHTPVEMPALTYPDHPESYGYPRLDEYGQLWAQSEPGPEIEPEPVPAPAPEPAAESAEISYHTPKRAKKYRQGPVRQLANHGRPFNSTSTDRLQP